MPRRLTDEPNELRIHDNISGSEILLFYRMPTTAERAAYANEMFRRVGRKVKISVGEARQKHGLSILTGIREGDFEARGRNGECEPIASDPESGRFHPDWKEKVAAHASDLVELLAIRVFDAPAVTAAVEEPDDDEDAEKN